MKNTMKRYLATLLTMLVLCTIFSASALAASLPASISAKSITIGVGARKNVYLKNNTKKVTWTTSDKSVAFIKADWNIVQVTGIKPGTSTVTAKIGKKKYSCKVKVKNVPKLSRSELTLNSYDTFCLEVTGTVSKPVWSVSDEKVVSINRVSAQKYQLTAVAYGTATVNAKVNGKTLSCKVTVPRPKTYGDTSNYNNNYKGDFDPRDVRNVVVPGISKDARQVGDVAYSINGTTERIPANIRTNAWPCCKVLELRVISGGNTDPMYKKVYLDPKDVSWVVEDPDLVNVKFYDCYELTGDWQAINKARGWGNVIMVVGSKGIVGSTKVHFYYKGLHWVTYVNVTEEEGADTRFFHCDICGHEYGI